jgi:hypothetical protein
MRDGYTARKKAVHLAVARLTSGASRVDSRERTNRLRSAPGMSAHAQMISPCCSAAGMHACMLIEVSAHVPLLYAVLRHMDDAPSHAQGDFLWAPSLACAARRVLQPTLLARCTARSRHNGA